MRIVSVVVARPLEACWRAFVDAPTMPQWVPGLRTAEIVDAHDGLPAEIHFDYAGNLSYSLRYDYDADNHTVRWEPRAGAGGVRGFARFEPDDDGTRFTYALEHDTGRKAAERALDDPQMLVDAFARWMHEERDR